MADLVQELKDYLRKTPCSQKFREWDALSEFDDCGPGVFDFLDSAIERIPEIKISNYQHNPEFSSLDFCFI